MHVSNLGYFGVTTTDPESWCRFATDVLGMMKVQHDAERLLRMDDYAWRIAVAAGEKDDIAFAGFEMPGKCELDTLVRRLADSGVVVTKADPTLVAARRVTELYQCKDPEGLPIELYYGALQRTETPFRSPSNARFITGDQGLGHIVLSAVDIGAQRKFYRDGLGLQLSDIMALRSGQNWSKSSSIIATLGTTPWLWCRWRHLIGFITSWSRSLISMALVLPAIGLTKQAMARSFAMSAAIRTTR